MALGLRASSLLMPLALAVALLVPVDVVSAQQKFGINYGQIANDLPDPTQVVGLLRSVNVNKVKLYDADPKVLTAFANTGVEFIIAVGNENLQTIASSSGAARQWVSQHVQPFVPATRITCIAVGNEVFTSNDTGMMASLVPAMKAVHGALVDLGMDRQVTVTSAHSVNFLATSFPPSSGVFREDLAVYIKPMLDFHTQTGSSLLINAYPFFAYKADPGSVSLPYVLFEPNPGVRDPNTNLKYDNMLYAQIDAVYAAMKAMGHTDVGVRISETGWPSKGDEDETGATVANAAAYNGNLMQRIAMGQGTPLKPDVPVDVYVFALFNEDMKPGPTSERNYGLFYPNGSPVYSIKASSGGGGNGIGPGGSFNDPYYTSMFSSSSRLAMTLGGCPARRIITLSFLHTYYRPGRGTRANHWSKVSLPTDATRPELSPPLITAGGRIALTDSETQTVNFTAFMDRSKERPGKGNRGQFMDCTRMLFNYHMAMSDCE